MCGGSSILDPSSKRDFCSKSPGFLKFERFSLPSFFSLFSLAKHFATLKTFVAQPFFGWRKVAFDSLGAQSALLTQTKPRASNLKCDASSTEDGPRTGLCRSQIIVPCRVIARIGGFGSEKHILRHSRLIFVPSELHKRMKGIKMFAGSTNHNLLQSKVHLLRVRLDFLEQKLERGY